MKALKLIAFLLFLNSSIYVVKACSYWPYGEDIRFSLFSSDLGGGADMEALFYSTHYFNEYMSRSLSGPDENLEEWYHYFDGKFKREVIDELIYRVSYEKPTPAMYKNKLYVHFQNGSDADVAEYVMFAKRVEYILKDDFWTGKKMDVLASEQALDLAKKRTKSSKNEMLKLRYAYQAVVLAYYLNLYDDGEAIYTKYVATSKEESVLKGWAKLYYANMKYGSGSDQDDMYKGRLYAQIFEETRSKNQYIFQNFSKDESIIKQTYALSENNEERGAIIAIGAFRNPARALKQIQQLFQINPKTELLDILLVREINKMEDWYFSDRYTGYGTGIETTVWIEEDERFNFIDAENFESDKAYLRQVISSAESMVNSGKIPNKALWHTSIAYMAYMLEDEKKTNTQLKKASKENSTDFIQAQIKTIDLLALVRFEEKWDESFQHELYQSIQEIEDYKEEVYNYDRFVGQLMLAISRKYLEEENVLLAALFESKVSGDIYEAYTSWGLKSYQTFDLLNENADIETMEQFFDVWEKPNKTKLEAWLYADMKSLKWRFTDLLGTMYFREDRLEEALAVYETIPDSVWQVENYELHYHYKEQLDSNPFETKFTGSSPWDDRSVSYIKPEFVKELIRLKEQAKNAEKDRAYNYMMLGNAYFNMTYSGNSWYYTEYGWSSVSDQGSSGQNKDYYTGERALEYYKLAEEAAETQAMAAFCYRLQYKCYKIGPFETNQNFDDHRKYKERFLNRYPDHYENLKGCDHFDSYFAMWK